MPSGRIHDLVTLAFAPAILAVGFWQTHNPLTGALVAAAFVFGGLMFGPDLDTGSRQYSRWSVFRGIWLPYRALFRHRSRFSHGLILGALIRVLYFHAMLAMAAFIAIWLWTAYLGKSLPAPWSLIQTWNRIGGFAYAYFGDHLLLLMFLGIWLGAASHTLTDLAGSYITTGRVRGVF